jgi:hypothetical protein
MLPMASEGILSTLFMWSLCIHPGSFEVTQTHVFGKTRTQSRAAMLQMDFRGTSGPKRARTESGFGSRLALWSFSLISHHVFAAHSTNEHIVHPQICWHLVDLLVCLINH